MPTAALEAPWPTLLVVVEVAFSLLEAARRQERAAQAMEAAVEAALAAVAALQSGVAPEVPGAPRWPDKMAVSRSTVQVVAALAVALALELQPPPVTVVWAAQTVLAPLRVAAALEAQALVRTARQEPLRPWSIRAGKEAAEVEEALQEPLASVAPAVLPEVEVVVVGRRSKL
jgi:hypothetical protein